MELWIKNPSPAGASFKAEPESSCQNIAIVPKFLGIKMSC